MRYGAATWIDAAGHETAVAQAVEGDAIVLTVPREVLNNTLYPAVLDPVVSPEIDLGAIKSTVAGPSVAVVGTTYVAAWALGSNVVAQRVSAAGTLIDPSPVTVLTSNIGFRAQAVVSMNGTFVIAGQDNFMFHVRVMQPDGTFAAPESQTIYDPNQNMWFQPSGTLHLATNGSSYAALLAYAGNTDGGGDPSGQYEGIRLYRGTGPGAPTSMYVTPSAGWEEARSLATNGTDYLMLYWGDPTGIAPPVNRRAVYSGAGALVSSGTATCMGTALVWTGASYMAVSSASTDLVGCNVDASGVAVGGSFTLTSAAGTQSQPRAVFDGANTFIAWSDDRTGSADVYANWFTSAGAPLIPGDFPVANAANGEGVGGVTTSATGSALVGVTHFQSASLRFVSTTPVALGQPCMGAVD